MPDVYDFLAYKEWISAVLSLRAETTRGMRSLLAENIQIQLSYVTKVLNGEAHLSLEQADRAADFFQLATKQKEYFILLVEFARAGTPSLRENFHKQLKERRLEHLNLKKKFETAGGLSSEDKQIFYSSWHYAAVLHYLTITRYQNKARLARRLYLASGRLEEIFDFLVSRGLVILKDGEVEEVRGWEWLTGDASLVARDHCNWRLMAIRSFEKRGINDLHYSSVVTLSEEDSFHIKQLILRALDKSRKIIASSPGEKVCSFLIDFFEV